MTIVVIGFLRAYSGWDSLKARYAMKDRFTGDYWQSSGQLDHIAGALTLGANEQGLYIALLFLAPRGPASLIPWREIEVRNLKTGVWANLAQRFEVEFRFLAIPALSIQLRKDQARRLASAAGDEWTGKQVLLSQEW